MSCVQCSLHNNGFATEKEFSEFENLLETLVKAGKLIFLERNPDSRFIEINYQCKNCDAIWVLSIPDQAFRGGWHENRASSHF